MFGLKPLRQKWCLSPNGEFSTLLNPRAKLAIFSKNLVAMTTVLGAPQTVLDQEPLKEGTIKTIARQSLDLLPLVNPNRKAPPASVRPAGRKRISNVFTAPVPPPPSLEPEPAPRRKAPTLPNPENMLLFGGAACAVVWVGRRRRRRG